MPKVRTTESQSIAALERRKHSMTAKETMATANEDCAEYCHYVVAESQSISDNMIAGKPSTLVYDCNSHSRPFTDCERAFNPYLKSVLPKATE
jgi:hypothetical protein